MIIGLCDRFHCLPSEVGQEEAGIIRLLKIVNMCRPEQGEEEDYG